jgi:hypothetical protein
MNQQEKRGPGRPSQGKVHIDLTLSGEVVNALKRMPAGERSSYVDDVLKSQSELVDEAQYQAHPVLDDDRSTTKITVAVTDEQVAAIEDEIMKRLRTWKSQGLKVDKRKYDKSIILREILDEWLAQRE